MNATRKYPLLRVIATVLKVVAWVILIAGIIGLVAGLGAAGGMTAEMGVLKGIFTAGSWALPVLAIIWFVQLYAFGSIIALLIDIEENTRRMASE
ncbi:MAG: hypothetical protein BWY52_01276 [Chloroflexi bacterium ADurb.Bin325]|nr:MAG: hypothetical protein BWY52_01276 [Chloroflexi bacterium ADurb.Bin325]